MQTKQCTRFSDCRSREQSQELIGVLTAISIVSKRLAGKLAVLERREKEKSRVGKNHDTGQS